MNGKFHSLSTIRRLLSFTINRVTTTPPSKACVEHVFLHILCYKFDTQAVNNLSPYAGFRLPPL